MQTLGTLSSLVDGSSALNLGSSLADIAVDPFLALTAYMEPFVDIADGLATLLGLIA
ncbi:hypothetical protein [Corynebacterium lipophiloflavum]|uniref:Uncharacterized protein n=1 Tax=Corynebacterium lipophiloflavum (strain ATCC 700352 / DSM 44291 / CCUG 37336 / JCM 10383 / DMMZ 1944) TaxID=525263 RepID=C0XP35_CORLD|nr:hypothetical protein [Corynebacterium lipophiloflavum]EEI17988.1 hypothetical protein HMPREF0298_0205 [Corynebacterium lipophiloflavum DSM 44291]